MKIAWLEVNRVSILAEEVKKTKLGRTRDLVRGRTAVVKLISMIMAESGGEADVRSGGRR